MDLSKLIDMQSITSALIVAAILGCIAFIWRKREFLGSKIKSASLFLHLPEVKDYFSDIYCRTFQTHSKINTKPSLEEYIQSFGSWKSKSDAGITLRIKIDDEVKIYDNVTSVRASRISPFSPFYALDMEQNKPDYALYHESILGVRHSEIFKIARLCYFREIAAS